MVAWFGAGAVIYGGLLAGLYLFQRHLLYHPSSSVPDRVQAGLPDMVPVVLRTDDGLDLLAWYKPAPAPGSVGGKTVIYLHGNAGHIGHRGWKARGLLDSGHGVLLVSWRGFGGNAGKPGEEGLLKDGRAALGFIAGEGVRPGDVVLYGESLGSGIAVRLAAESAAAARPVGAVMLEAPYTSIAAVAQHHYFYIPASYRVTDRYDAAAHIAAIGAPLFVMHGELDRTVPVRFGRELFDLAKEPKQAAWLAKADHNDLYEFGAGKAMLEFLKTLPR